MRLTSYLYFLGISILLYMAEKTKPLKNFLSVTLGLLTRKIRMEMGLDYEDVSIKTGIKSSYFQTFEQGNAIYHLAKATQLYNLFKDQYPRSLTGIIEILSLITIVENKGTEFREAHRHQDGKLKHEMILEQNIAYNQGLKKGFQELGSAEKKYLSLYRKYLRAGIFECNNNDALIECIENNNLIQELSSFVFDYHSYATRLTEKMTRSLYDFVEGITSFYFDFLDANRENLRSLPGVIDSYKLRNWEERNANGIDEAYLILNKAAIDSPTFAHSSYFYLFAKDFKKLVIYIYQTDEKIVFTTEKLREYLKNLYEHTTYRKYYIPDELWEKVKGKISIKYISSEEIIKKIFSRNEMAPAIDVFWLYKMKRNYYVGITTASNFYDEDTTPLQSLRYGELLNKIEIIDELMETNDD